MYSTTRLRVVVLLILIVVGLASSLGTAWRTGDWEGLFLNLGTEMLGAVATYVLLELFIGGRERREARKADLIAQMGSDVKDVAIAAAEELRRHGWLHDGSLRGAILDGAKLDGAKLEGASLQGAKLSMAKLQGVYLAGADLERANLEGANLEGAKLQRANLQGANLQGANLQGANLQGVYLERADLKWANLEGAAFGENTILPDSTKWTPGTNMARFIARAHRDF